MIALYIEKPKKCIMKPLLYSWIIALPTVILIDLIWFSFSVQRFYKPHLEHIISGEFQYVFALVFYVVYAFGISFLVVIPSYSLSDSMHMVAIKGFVLGLTAYAAYNLTNQATIKDWPVIVTLVDTLWGATLTALVCSITYKTLHTLIK